MLLATGINFAQVDRSKLPASGPAPEIKIGEAETFTLANGLKVFVVKNTKLPRVSFTLVLELKLLQWAMLLWLRRKTLLLAIGILQA